MKHRATKHLYLQSNLNEYLQFYFCFYINNKQTQASFKYKLGYAVLNLCFKIEAGIQ